ncbi:phage protein [Vibrio parahaemolyticus]|uniref:phage protein n=1 Tax=Vibrio harveyi group TaxID=717610 RepID=UPI0011205C0F|nr:phage protein [Vibrio parahaemolyticus]MBE4094579.1 regulator [Vibrio parahaemolyticus]MBE5117847.1 regulator [Vibrio parahaemolyticus]MBE5169356.1 regulator [Vibrio parahaemolyticus]TOG35350.1 regulator [Vibrio parahaemolyticus]
MTNFRKMSKNYVFREFECGLSVEEAAKLCFKSVRAVKLWDSGKPIPPECKRLMRMTKGRELATSEAWENFKMHKDKLELPTGQLVTPQEILTGIALLEIGAKQDLVIATKLMKYVRILCKIKNHQ